MDMIVGLDPAKIIHAKESIKKFRRELARSLEKGHRREVYMLAINFIPLTVPADAQ